jgi:serine/threonine protein kinase
MTIASTLADALRQYHLLEGAQLDEVTHTLQPCFPDSKALARELIRRSWITPYQANQLLQGRGQELLLGSYVLLERVGEGGMGQVFKARNWKLGRIVALKVIRKEKLNNAEAILRFEREVRAAAALSHPNIVMAHDADQISGTHLLVMEYIEGATDLAKLVKQRGPLPVAQACEYIRQAALGLQHACERGLVHRDIKPQNLLLTADGRTLKILDMGLARLDQPGNEDQTTMTQLGVVMGTPDYIAPEQALASHTVDIRADLYSLGCTFYFLLTGQVPFPGLSATEKLIKHQLEEPPPLAQFRSDIPPAVADVVMKLLAKKPVNRYQTPAELAAALDAVFNAGIPTAVALKTENSADTFNTSFASMVNRAVPTAERPQSQSEPGSRRWVLYGLAGIGFLGVGIWLVQLLFFRKAAGQQGEKPDAHPRNPVKLSWDKQVAALPAREQVDAVAARLKELNPGFDGKTTHKIENEVVVSLSFLVDNVADVSPVRALTGLQSLSCSGSAPGKGKLLDLTPLAEMKLTNLNCSGTKVASLWPVKNMKLTSLNCGGTKVAELSALRYMELLTLVCKSTQVDDLLPLKGMPLTSLDCSSTRVGDLSPLKGMPLKNLSCSYTRVSNLAPLKGMPLTSLDCDGAPVLSLAALKDANLTVLHCQKTRVIDLSPIKKMPLTELRCDFKPERDAATLRSIRTLEKINDKPARQFWKEVDDMNP